MDLEALAEGLRPALAELEQEEAELRKRLAEITADRRRVETSIRALTVRAAVKKSIKKGTPGRKPNEALITLVYQFVADHPDGVTVKDVSRGADVGDSAADRVLRLLREREDIRLAGKRGPANLYKPLTTTGALNGGPDEA